MKGKHRSGIRRKYLRYTVALLLAALLLTFIAVWFFIRNNLTAAVMDSYEFMTERMGISLDGLFEKSDEVTAECILNDDVQASLLSGGLSGTDKSSLSKYFAYVDLDDVDEYCYVDNNGNTYTRSYSKITYEDFLESGLAEELGDDYASTQWFWAEDNLFSDGEKALFIGRYVRNMEYSHEPGMLFFKMSPDYLARVWDEDEDEELAQDVFIGVTDDGGEMVASWFPAGEEMTPEELGDVADSVGAGEPSTVNVLSVKGGELLTYTQKDCGFTVFTFVPNRVLTGGMMRVVTVLILIYIVILVAAIILSIFFSNRFTRPIRQISDAMSRFDGRDFSNTIELATGTELDQIGSSYNEMLANIKRQVDEIRQQEEALRTTEMNMLIAQINPHFLYNTLDTIYMLARLNREGTTMKMIQALSTYLHICLSKGSDMVTVSDELENVKSYMEIQQIRNRDFFNYEIDCRVDSDNIMVLKLILQPLVENAMNHAFDDIYQTGFIRIKVYMDGGELVFEVYNSGTPMSDEMVEKMNGLMDMPVVNLQSAFTGKQHGYGVVNIITRLRLKYGGGVRFYYEVDGEGTRCFIRIPQEDWA
ncbi:MAG: sensor histidine kinase [Clostridiales bacterium]|nr:sensor histidine kinase [Clostridiales bacterium]